MKTTLILISLLMVSITFLGYIINFQYSRLIGLIIAGFSAISQIVLVIVMIIHISKENKK
jgi:hypothetical protein